MDTNQNHWNSCMCFYFSSLYILTYNVLQITLQCKDLAKTEATQRQFGSLCVSFFKVIKKAKQFITLHEKNQLYYVYTYNTIQVEMLKRHFD